jgi:2'-5' RNA ligase
MPPFDLSDVVAAAAALPAIPLVKLASITLTDRTRFLYCPLPADIVAKWTNIQDSLVPSDGTKQEIDHITVCYCPKAAEPVSPADIDKVVKALKDVAEDHGPIAAKASGWSYFDGAQHDGKACTALVVLVSAPGLDTLQGEMKSVLERMGCAPSSTYSFNPHITFCYLPHGGRVADLPILSGEFTIDRLCFAAQDIHDIPLKGGAGVKSASGDETMKRDEFRAFLSKLAEEKFSPVQMAKGMKVEQEHHKGPEETKKIVKEHLVERPDYYTAIEKCLGKES